MPISVGSTELCDLGDIKVGSQDSQEVFAGADKVFPCTGGAGQCFTFDESKICLPMAAAGFVGGIANGAWHFEVEFNLVDASVASVEGLFQTEPQDGSAGILDLGFAKVGISVNTWKVGLARTYGSNFGSVYTVDPGFGEWYRVRLGYDGVSDDINLVVTRLGTGDEDDLHSAFGGAPSELIEPRESICLGVMQQQTGKLATGQFRNAKLVQNGVTLANWPIQGQTLDDGTVEDVSGNGHHGTVSIAGSGTWGPCP